MPTPDRSSFARDPRPHEQPAGSSRWILAWIALGIALRFTALGAHSLWFDEGASIAVARCDDLLGVLRADRHPPLSYLALRGWIAAFGESDAALRALPALVSSLALLAFAAWVRRARAATAAVALFAVAPFQVWHGQELRMYAFVELAGLIAWLGLERFCSGQRRSGAAVVCAATFAATGSHFLGGLLVPTIAVVAWLRRRALGPRPALALGAACALGAVLWLPWLASVSGSSFAWGRLGHNDLRAVLEFPIRQILTGFGAVPAAWVPAVYALGLSFAIGWIALAWRVLRHREASEVELLVMAGLPIAACWMLDACSQIGFLSKYAIVAAPAVVLAAAQGLALLRPRWIAQALTVFGILGAASLTLWLRQENRFEDFRGASAQLLASWRQGDRVVVITGTPEPFSSGAVAHYARGRGEVRDSFVAEKDLEGLLGAGLAPGVRLHVIHRDGESGAPAMARVEAALQLLQREARSIRVEHSLWQAPPR